MTWFISKPTSAEDSDTPHNTDLVGCSLQEIRPNCHPKRGCPDFGVGAILTGRRPCRAWEADRGCPGSC